MVAHTAAWSAGDAWLRDVLAYLQGNRDLLGQLLRERLPQVGCIQPQGTYLAWLDCRALPLDCAPHLFFRRHAQVAMTDGAECGEGGQGHVRFNFAMPSRCWWKRPNAWPPRSPRCRYLPRQPQRHQPKCT